MASVVRAYLLALCLAGWAPGAALATDWFVVGADDRPLVQAWFFWSQSCPHCTTARPHVARIAAERPWLLLHDLEVSREPANLARYATLAEELGAEAVSVPALVFCGELHVGWDDDATTGALLRERLDACHAALPGAAPDPRPARQPQPARPPAPAADAIRVPLLGEIDAGALSLPALTLVLAGLDAFNPCAFFVLLFLLSMMAHQKSRARMLLVGGIFVATSGLMYFAFMAAWLSVFQLFGHLAWVTLAAGTLALLVGLLNLKDALRPGAGPTLSIPESRKPDLFRRARAILAAGNPAAMLLATGVLAVAANVYELLCTAGFPMVYTRLLTLADLSPAARLGWLAAYNLIYVVPLAAIVAVFAGTLGARKLTEREGRLLKLMSGLMMAELGALLLLAPERLGQPGVAFGLMAVAVGATWLASRRHP